MTTTATYVFALVVRSRKPVVPRALPSLPLGSRPAIVAVKPGWWLVVCDVPLSAYGPDGLQRHVGDLEWVSAVALAHEQVIEAFLRPDAVLPLKLFTLFSTRARACRHFLEREADLQAVIARVSDSEEWGVRVAVRPGWTAPTAAGSPPRRAAASGAGYLLGKKARYEAASTRQGRIKTVASELLGALGKLASDSRTRNVADEDGGQGALVIDAALLVPRAGVARLKAAAARHARTLVHEGFDLTLTGPWPPYSFVQD